MVGNSAALRRILRQVEVVASTDANVLILGETGTGKELVARAIHRLRPRRSLPFVILNCAAIPTGAHQGTLFLDEVGDIPLDLQPKLLRALQEKSFERLGGTRTIPIDVRLIAATNRNLTQMMGDKLFRSDLYYGLKVFPITTPPLRDHPEDIAVLARHLTQKYARKMNKQIERFRWRRCGPWRVGRGPAMYANSRTSSKGPSSSLEARTPGPLWLKYGPTHRNPRAAARWRRWRGSISFGCSGRQVEW